MKKFAVIGLGRFGQSLAIRLGEMGVQVMAIDNDEKKINAIASQVSIAVTADATDKETLKRLDVADCDTCIVAIGTNISASVMITMNLIDLGVDRVCCKAHDAMHKKILRKLGAELVYIPEQEIAEKMASNLIHTNVFDYIDLSDEYGVLEIVPLKKWVGKTIAENDIRNKYHVSIIAVRALGELNINPKADYIVNKDDSLIILGANESLEKMRNLS